eukprot:scaffold8003_cov255-Prasinococcus_capsulatus_cf.AAC.1
MPTDRMLDHRELRTGRDPCDLWGGEVPSGSGGRQLPRRAVAVAGSTGAVSPEPVRCPLRTDAAVVRRRQRQARRTRTAPRRACQRAAGAQ